jgi:hypothetical protein
LNRLNLLALTTLLACGGPDKSDDAANTEDSDGTDGSDNTDGSDGTEGTNGTEGTDPDTGTEAPAEANAKATGTWSLTSPGPACNYSMGGDWAGAASTANAYNFTLVQADLNLSCAFNAITPSDFTCSEVNYSGVMGGTCLGTLAVTDVHGAVVGDAASISATFQVTSSNCGVALNCGPTTATASGLIAP